MLAAGCMCRGVACTEHAWFGVIHCMPPTASKLTCVWGGHESQLYLHCFRCCWASVWGESVLMRGLTAGGAVRCWVGRCVLGCIWDCSVVHDHQGAGAVWGTFVAAGWCGRQLCGGRSYSHLGVVPACASQGCHCFPVVGCPGNACVLCEPPSSLFFPEHQGTPVVHHAGLGRGFSR